MLRVERGCEELQGVHVPAVDRGVEADGDGGNELSPIEQCAQAVPERCSRPGVRQHPVHGRGGNRKSPRFGPLEVPAEALGPTLSTGDAGLATAVLVSLEVAYIDIGCRVEGR